ALLAAAGDGVVAPFPASTATARQKTTVGGRSPLGHAPAPAGCACVTSAQVKAFTRPPQRARVRVRPANDGRSRCCGLERHWRTGRNGGCGGSGSAAVIRPPTTITPVSQRRLRGRRHSD